MGTEEQGAGGRGKEVLRQDRRTRNQEGKTRKDQGGIGRLRKKVDLNEGWNAVPLPEEGRERALREPA